MSAVVRFVKPEHVEVLQEYLCHEGVILIFPPAQNKAIRNGWKDRDFASGYDFGGEGDTWVDKLYDANHFFLESYEEYEEHEKGETNE